MGLYLYGRKDGRKDGRKALMPLALTNYEFISLTNHMNS
jgi:hypothetical protein